MTDNNFRSPRDRLMASLLAAVPTAKAIGTYEEEIPGKDAVKIYPNSLELTPKGTP